MEYKIIYDKDINDLEDEVNKWLKAGWKLAGGVCAARLDKPYAEEIVYHQAVYKD